jgi:hypothetical protein
MEKIYGNWEKSYNELPMWLLAFQHYLPGSITDIEALPFIKDGHVDPGKAIYLQTYLLEFQTMHQCICLLQASSIS